MTSYVLVSVSDIVLWPFVVWFVMNIYFWHCIPLYRRWEWRQLRLSRDTPSQTTKGSGSQFFTGTVLSHPTPLLILSNYHLNCPKLFLRFLIEPPRTLPKLSITKQYQGVHQSFWNFIQSTQKSCCLKIRVEWTLCKSETLW